MDDRVEPGRSKSAQFDSRNLTIVNHVERIQVTNIHNNSEAITFSSRNILAEREGSNYIDNSTHDDSVAHLGAVLNSSSWPDSSLDQPGHRLLTHSNPQVATRAASLPEIASPYSISDARGSRAPIQEVTYNVHQLLNEQHTLTIDEVATFAAVIADNDTNDEECDCNIYQTEDPKNPGILVAGSEPIEEQEDNGEHVDWLEMSKAPKNGTLSQDITVIHQQEEPESTTGATWIKPGRVIVVRDHDDHHINGRTMVLMARSSEGFLQCLALCRHLDMLDIDNEEFFSSHMEVRESSLEQELQESTDKTQSNKKQVRICIHDRKKSELRGNCWVNCEHVWTIRNTVPFMKVGYVLNFEEVLHKFTDVQNSLYTKVMKQLNNPASQNLLRTLAVNN